MFRPRVIVLLLVLVTMLAYLPALQGKFLNFDDQQYVTQNTAIQDGINPTSLTWAFTSYHASNWHPMTWITLMLDYQLFRLNPAGYHFVNILFHCANAGLLFVLLLFLTEQLWPSAFVAALFAWHPLHVESVAWISELKDVSSTFWGLLSMLAYVHYARKIPGETELANANEAGQSQLPAKRNPAGFYWLSLGLFALSLMSKSMLVTLPFVLLLLDYWPLQRIRNIGRCVVEKLPFLLLAAGVSALTVQAQKNTAMASFSAVPFQLRLENAVTAYAGYLWQAIWPAKLAILYPLPDQISPVKLALCALALALISAMVVFGRRQQPWLPVGWLWYLGTLVPVIGLVQVGSQSMADRYTYFPLIGVFLAVTLSVAALARRWHIPRPMLAATAILLLAACLARTEQQLRYWRDTQTLFTHALNVSTNNPLAHLVLGDAYQQEQQYDKAMAEYQEASKLSSDQPLTYQNIGCLLKIEGKTEEALKYFQVALKLKPQSAALHDNIGALLIQLKRYDEAGEEFAKAIQLDPSYAPAHFRMGWTLLRKGQGTEAQEQFEQAIRLEPDNVVVLLYVARVMSSSDNAQVRDGAEACRLAQRAEKLTNGRQPDVLDTLAAAYAECGRFDDAVATQQQALRLATKTGSTNDVPAMKKRLKLYRQHQPWRKSFINP